ncbi:uncharacterized protein TM35_000231840 [Trypanosoma theileri]|uniref:LIM zinc-binding domain-containing protein n=1 Tax=Trypanosoma theileri TaxID=67003 RepID=A0A1X0NRV2_9TRYP|nr:uncharacterized protein TM35_000231840 [Trypanosoma theileri]ORC87213.1 hypothetical protein TM35_000231840 [Trypanosoma theileri]
MSSDPDQNEEVPQQPVETPEETTQEPQELQDEQEEPQEEPQEDEPQEEPQELLEEPQEEPQELENEQEEPQELENEQEEPRELENEQEEPHPLDPQEDVKNEETATQETDIVSEKQHLQSTERDVSHGGHTDEATEAYYEGVVLQPSIGRRAVLRSSGYISNTPEDRSTVTKEGGQGSVADYKSQMSETLPPSTSRTTPGPANTVDVEGVSKVADETIVPERKTPSPLRSSSLRHASSTSMKRRIIPSGTLTPLYTANYMTTREEYMAFRTRNGVSPNYTGPVHVVENVYVACAACSAPVDPVTRVPAGRLFFHPQCIRCKLCGKSSLTEAYFPAMYNAAICSECAVRGLGPCVSREAAVARGIIPGAVCGNLATAIRRHDRQRSVQPINQSTLEGVVPPTLSIPPLHNRRNSTHGTMALIRRQQYYTQNDNNILCLPPAASTSDSVERSRSSSTSQKRRSRKSIPKLM